MKRIINLVLSAVMLVGVAGCTQKTATDTEVPTLIWYVPGNPQSDVASVMDAVNEIIEPKIGAKLDLRYLDEGAFSEKMSMMYSAQEEFDLTFAGYCNGYLSSVDLGAIVPMKDLLKENAPRLFEEIPQYVWDVAYVDNDIYAVPNMQIMANIGGWFFFKDIADKYGIKEGMEFTDERQLEPYLEAIKAGEPGVYPIATASSYLIQKDYSTIHQSPAMFINKKTLQISCETDIPEYQESLKLAREWHEKGYIRPDLDVAGSKIQEDIKAGRYAAWNGRWKPGIEADMKKMYGRDVVFVRYAYYNSLGGGTDTMTAISRTSKHPEKAAKLLEVVNTDKEVYNLISYGIAGKHYERLDGDYIKPIEGSGYSVLASWKFGNQFNSYLLEGQEPDVWEQTKKANDEAYIPPQRGFVLDTKTVKTDIALCNSVTGEYASLGTGVVENWEEKAEERKNRLDNAGQQKIREEVQRQFDEWYKNKESNK